jgi:hypothetical protein
MADSFAPVREADLVDGEAVDLKQLSAISIKESIPKDALKTALATPPFVPLEGSLNLRDIGLLPGSPIKPGLIYRSGSLHNIPSSLFPRFHNELNIKTVFDLRHEKERQQFPEPEIPGVDMVWLKSDTPPKLVDPASFVERDGIPGFVAMYKGLLTLCASGYKKILEHLRDHPNEGILWHCTHLFEFSHMRS